MNKFFINSGYFKGRSVLSEENLEKIKSNPKESTLWFGGIGVCADAFRGEVIGILNKPVKTFINYGSFKF